MSLKNKKNDFLKKKLENRTGKKLVALAIYKNISEKFSEKIKEAHFTY